MRIGIDVREFKKGTYTGLRTVMWNFLTYVDKTCEHEFFFFGNQHTDMNSIPTVGEKIVLNENITFFWDQRRLPLALREQKIDVFLSPYIKTPWWRVCPYVNIIADIIPLKISKYAGIRSFVEKAYFILVGFISSHRVVKTITISNTSKDDIKKVFRIPDKKIEVIYVSTSISDQTTGEMNGGAHFDWNDIGTGYILYVGNFKFHKNMYRLVEAYGMLPKEVRLGAKLVLAGGAPQDMDRVQKAVSERNLEGDIVLLGAGLSDSEIKGLMYKALAFIFPSLCEGFGLPPLEAMACGVPVAASKLKPMTEVLGDAAIFFDPYDPKKISDAILQLIQQGGLRKRCIAKGLERAGMFDSREMAKNILEVLEGAERDRWKKAVIIGLGGIGNMVLASSMIKGFKRRYGGEIKIVVAEKAVAELLKLQGIPVDEIMLTDGSILDWLKVIWKLRRSGFCAGFAAAYTNWFKSWLFFLAVGVKTKVSFAPESFSFLFERSVSDVSLHEYEMNKEISKIFGVELPTHVRINIDGDSGFAERFFEKNRINRQRIIVGLHPGSGEKQGHFKRWPIEKFAKLINLLRKELNAEIILVGADAEKELKKALDEAGAEFVSAVGKTDLNELASLLKKCDIVVGNDSGIIHFAGAIGTPIVAIFGPTDFKKTRPMSENARIIRKEIKCSPCYVRGKVKCKQLDCFSGIKVQDVFDGIKRLLAETGRFQKR